MFLMFLAYVAYVTRFIIQHRPYRLLNRAKQLFEDLNELPSEVIHGA